MQSSSLEQLEPLLLLSSEQVPAPVTGLLIGLSVGCFEGLAVFGLDVVGLSVFGLDVVGLAVIGLDVVGLSVFGLDVMGLAVIGLDVVGLAVIGLDVVGLAVFGLGVVGPVVGEGQGFKSLCESPWQTLRPHESC